MRLDTGQRSFVTLLTIALGPYIVLGLAGCGLMSVAAHRLASSGAIDAGPGVAAALVFVAVTLVGLALGVRSAWQQAVATRRLGHDIARGRCEISPDVQRVVRTIGLTRVDLVDDVAPYCFTYGMLAPRIALSRGLVDAASPEELAAVLAHERYHVRNLDPLKVVIARTLAATFFFLPALRHLRTRYLAGRELAADRAAVRACGARPLAGALYKVVAAPTNATLGGVAAIGGTDVLDLRLAQLEHRREPALPAVPRLATTATTLGLALATVGLAATTMGTLGDTALPVPDSIQETAMGLGGMASCVVLWLVAGFAVLQRLAASRA